MVRALILDYNGVIVNDEPIHLQAFLEVLSATGIGLDEEEYQTRYLGVSDRDILRDLVRRKDPSRAGTEKELAGTVDHLLALKAMAYRRRVRTDLPEVEGASEFILKAAERWPIAVASGALRVEVEDGLYRLGVRDAITVIVAAEDVTRGKPDPEPFIRAREALLRICTLPGSRHALSPGEPTASFLVIEDSPPGLAAARAAWMRAVGVLTSRPAADMKPADLVAADLRELTPERIEAL